MIIFKRSKTLATVLDFGENHAAERLVTTRTLRCSVAGLTGPFELLRLAAQELWAAVIEHSRSVIINRQPHAIASLTTRKESHENAI